MKDTLNPNEWIVMDALWEQSPATLSEAIRQIGDKAQWSYKTYQSYMAVLEKKGYIKAERRGRDNFYSPIKTREQCVEQESRSILSKMETDSVKLLVASMVRDGDLTDGDYEDLKLMLDKLIKSDVK